MGRKKPQKFTLFYSILIISCVVFSTACTGNTDKNQINTQNTVINSEIGTEDNIENNIEDNAEDDTKNIAEAMTESTELTGDIVQSTDSAQDTDSLQTEPEITGEYDFTLCFGGDISLDEKAVTTAKLDASEGDISKCISPELLSIMRKADIMCLNNEFTFSENGSPMEGKAYTFRAKPERVSVLLDMGVDIVQLSNNHVYDYGKQALLDTLTTLEGAGIDYFGAGRNLDEAMSPVYYALDEKVVAFVGASRAEKNKMTPQATEEKPGILRCYDTELFLQAIAEADANADFVVAVVHWGTEYSYGLEDIQVKTGKEYLDAGADVIIGGHSHCLQGMEFYSGKPILYSLGNYWFNNKTLDSMLVELRFFGNDKEQNLEVKMIPAIQTNATTNWVEKEEQQRIFEFMESISINVEIDEDGIVREKATVKED